MSSYQDVPCLLLVVFDEVTGEVEKPADPLDQPLVRGYALLPQDFKNDHPEVVEEFLHNHIRVLSNDQAASSFPVAAETLILFEAELCSVRPEAETGTVSAIPSVEVLVGVKERPFFTSLKIRWATEHDEMNWLKHKFGDIFNFCDFTEVCASGAIDEDNLEIINTLLLHDFCIEYGLYRGQILHFAVERGHEALVKLLLSNNAKIERDIERSFLWSLPLDIAIKMGFLRIAELLLAHGAIDTSDKNASNLRRHAEDAIRYRHIEVFKLLLEFGEKANIPCNIPCLLDYSVNWSLPEFVEHILSLSPVLTNEWNKRTFQFAFLHREKSADQMECYEKMKEYGFRVDYSADSSSSLLFGAIVKNWFEVVQTVLKSGADVNKVFEYPEDCLSYYKDEEANEDEDTRLEDLRLHIFSYLGARLPCPSTKSAEFALCYHKKWTPLHMAAACAGEEVIELLLEHGADVNAELEGRTPIYDAIEAHNLDAFYALIANGANIMHNSALLRLAVERGHPNTVLNLLLHRTPLSMEDRELQRLLAFAAAARSVNVVELLLMFGVQPNAEFAEECRRTRWGSTLTAGHSDILQAVLNYSFTGDFMAACTITGFLFENSPEICPHCRENMAACSDVVLRHAVKLWSAELMFDDQKVPSRFASDESVDEFRKNCEAEVARLKNERLGDSYTTFYDVLVGNMCQLARYAKHVDFLEIRETEDYKSQFPIYAGVLGCQFDKGTERRGLLDEGLEICSQLSVAFNELPDIVKERVVSYLNNYELQVLWLEFLQFADEADEN